MANTKTKKGFEVKEFEQGSLSKIMFLEEQKGMTPSSMITLIIPPKYCI